MQKKESNPSSHLKIQTMITSGSLDNILEIGAVFTPQKWAKFAIEQFGLFEKWIEGATIFDPTMGEGNLLFAFIEKGIEKGFNPGELPIDRLYGVELNKSFLNSFFNKAKKLYGINLPLNNYSNEDIFFQRKENAFNILFGNPPWQNFVDLPEEYKPKIKGQFFLYDLVGNAQDLLLGGSRIDIAALVLQKTIQKNLVENGEAVFFVPLSLFLNDGANKFFRKYKVNGVEYCITKIFDFNDLEIFDGIATRYGLIHILRDKKQVFPVEYERWEKNQWVKYIAKPLIQRDDPLSIIDDKNGVSFKFQPISVKKSSQPRQGVNTCGANQIFFFDFMEKIDSYTCEVSNKHFKAVLPRQYIYPVITSRNFSEKKPSPQKWVLLPYSEKTGRPLNSHEIIKENLLWKYLKEHEKELRSRKGTLINVWIRKGIWWALLGVGEYNFYPHKVVWEAYGKTSFIPKIFSGRWQANQSLQAFMPMTDIKEATKILKLLSNEFVEQYLLSHKMGGTMNWAQPGKIKKLLKLEEDQD
jgi:hypothetical protein